MKRLVTMAMGFVLSVLMIASVQAGVQSEQSGTEPKAGLSKRNKAVIQQSEAAQKRKELIQSIETGTMKKISKRNKAMLKQSEEAKKRKSLIKSSETGSMPK